MSKESAKSYTERCKEQYLNNAKFYPNKSVALFGWEKGNIGEGIRQVLEADDHDVSCFPFYIHDINDVFPHDFKIYDTIIFNCGYTHLDWIEDQPFDEIDRVLDSCLRGQMQTTKQFVNETIDTHSIKTIIYIGSMAHNHVLNASAPYCAAKAGLQMFAKCMAYELAPKGYRVYCINPSNVQDAPMSEATIQGLERFRGLSRKEAEAYWGAECPMGTFLTMHEIGEVCAFLLTPSARYLSGTEINLAGGQR